MIGQFLSHFANVQSWLQLLGTLAFYICNLCDDYFDKTILLLFVIQVQEKLKHWSQSFSNAFQSGKFEEAVISVQRMTYYVRVNDEIMKKLWYRYSI